MRRSSSSSSSSSSSPDSHIYLLTGSNDIPSLDTSHNTYRNKYRECVYTGQVTDTIEHIKTKSDINGEPLRKKGSLQKQCGQTHSLKGNVKIHPYS